METPADMFQRRLRTLIMFDRPMTEYERELKAAVESDPRIRVTKLQVRRYMKSDRSVFSLSRGGNTTRLLLLFDFQCPCGELRREARTVPLGWKRPIYMTHIKDSLKNGTYEHLAAEGLL